MKLLNNLYRMSHYAFYLGVRVLPFPKVKIISGKGSIAKIPNFLNQYNYKNILIVTDESIVSLGLIDVLLKKLDEYSIDYTIYSGVKPNPTINQAEEAAKAYVDNGCDGIVAVGGGSPMDCAKVAAARISNPNKSVRDMKGQFKVTRKPPIIIAVPTTSGTGSECTIAAVITDGITHEKFAITDMKLTPKVAVLDYELTRGLPKHITSTTGMDALTHAVEAYLSIIHTKETDEYAIKCIKLVFSYLQRAYINGDDMDAREAMAKAAYFGGMAFTRVYVGNVHAMAHQLGGMYNVPHGLANAVILPVVLDYYDETVYRRLAELARHIKLNNDGENSEEILAKRFIAKIREINISMDIPIIIPEINEVDIKQLAKQAVHEANPTYPVPKIMEQNECEKLYGKLIES